MYNIIHVDKLQKSQNKLIWLVLGLSSFTHVDVSILDNLIVTYRKQSGTL